MYWFAFLPTGRGWCCSGCGRPAAFVCATYYAPGSHALQLLNRIDEEVILISAPFRERGCLMTQAGRSAFICVLVFLLFFSVSR